jgi:hypothetical protein
LSSYRTWRRLRRELPHAGEYASVKAGDHSDSLSRRARLKAFSIG